MFDQENLQELLQFNGGEEQVVSVYMDADVAQRTSEKVKLHLRTLLKDVAPAYDADVRAIESYFDYAFPWGTPGVAVFSCASQDFFRAYPVSVTFRRRLRIRTRPYVKPLVHLLEYYADYGVTVVDQIGAQFYCYHLGELTDTGGVMGADVRKLKRGSGSSVMGMRGGQGVRGEEEQVLRNMREAAEVAGKFYERRKIRRLFVAGTAENVAQFRELLPRKLQSCIAGTFAVDMDAGEPAVRQRSLALLQELNAEREQRLVEQMVSSAAAGGAAVTGLGETLRMVSDGRVATLIVSEDDHAGGYRHESTGYLMADADEELFGDNGYAPLDDVVEEAVARTLEQSGQVEFVSDNAGLEEARHIRAILRY